MVEAHGKAAHGETLSTYTIAHDAVGSDDVVEQPVDAGWRNSRNNWLQLLQLSGDGGMGGDGGMVMLACHVPPTTHLPQTLLDLCMLMHHPCRVNQVGKPALQERSTDV